MRKCSMCNKYVKLSEWPIYKGIYYSYCRDCKRLIQREWVRAKREINKYCK